MFWDTPLRNGVVWLIFKKSRQTFPYPHVHIRSQTAAVERIGKLFKKTIADQIILNDRDTGIDHVLFSAIDRWIEIKITIKEKPFNQRQVCHFFANNWMSSSSFSGNKWSCTYATPLILLFDKMRNVVLRNRSTSTWFLKLFDLCFTSSSSSCCGF